MFSGNKWGKDVNSSLYFKTKEAEVTLLLRQAVGNLTVDLQYLQWERFAGRCLKSIKDKAKIL